MEFINLTPHIINLNVGTEFPQSKLIAEITQSYTPFKEGISKISFGGIVVGKQDPKTKKLIEIQPFPKEKEGVKYIVSLPTLMAAKQLGWTRTDIVAPATRHPETKKNEKGWILGVPGFLTL